MNVSRCYKNDYHFEALKLIGKSVVNELDRAGNLETSLPDEDPQQCFGLRNTTILGGLPLVAINPLHVNMLYP